MKRPLLDMTPSPSYKDRLPTGSTGTASANQFLLEVTDSENDYEDWLEERQRSKAANNEDFDLVSLDTSSHSSDEPLSPSTVQARE
jgi:hypothetical protein